jgi:hypothetical protein
MELSKGTRYTFYKKNADGYPDSVFRARFIQIYTNQSVWVDCVEGEKSATTKFCFPLKQLLKATNLERILNNQSNIPVDVLRIIDSYL